MKVRVRYFTTLRELAGTAEEELDIDDEASLADLISQVASKYGKEAHNYLYQRGRRTEVDPSIYFLVNGMNSRLLSGLKTKLKDGDTVAIIPPIGGGCSICESL